MKLRTDDISINTDDWTEIPLLSGGTYVGIVDVRYNEIIYKIGDTGNSNGISYKMIQDNILLSPTSIYVKKIRTEDNPVVVVIRDYE